MKKARQLLCFDVSAKKQGSSFVLPLAQKRLLHSLVICSSLYGGERL